MKARSEKSGGDSGFTLAELLIVVVVVSILYSVLIFNFRASQNNSIARHQLSSQIISDIRRMQAMALSGTDFNGSPMCGFGVYAVGGTSTYILFTRPPVVISPLETRCTGDTGDYTAGTDTTLETKTASSRGLTVNWSVSAGGGGGNTNNIFFLPPNPKTFISNSDDKNKTATINIVVSGAICPGSNCTQITVYTSGKIDVTN